MANANFDLEFIKERVNNSLKESLEGVIDEKIRSITTRSKTKDSKIEYEEGFISTKDAYKLMIPHVENAIMVVATNLVERQDTKMSELKDELSENMKNEMEKIKNEFNQKLLDSKLRDDALEQYKRRDSIRIYGVPQDEAEKTNSNITMNKVLETMKKIGLENQVKKENISATHRIHRKKSNSLPDPIIVKFTARQTKDLVVSNSSKLKESTNTNPKQFINEDLTPLRSKLLTFIKTKVPLVLSKSVHTREGRILCKKTADQSKWIYIESVRDLHKLSVDNPTSTTLLKELDLDNCMIEV